MDHNGIIQIHLAAQYLAAAAISFLDHKEDDSHTNLGHNPRRNEIFTRPLSPAGDYLALALETFSLRWDSPSGSSNFYLQNSSHREALSWINLVSESHEISGRYQYSFHYTLPYEISDNYTFHVSAEDLLRERRLRNLATNALLAFINEHSMESEIRIWPHHFDTGAFAALPGKEQVAIGLGLAIPDTLIDSHYFYLSGYAGHKSIDTSSFDKLSNGQWLNNGFKGAVLEADDYSERQIKEFYKEAIQAYRD